LRGICSNDFVTKAPFNTSGIIKRHPDGFGFLLPDDTKIEDVYIPKHSMTGVMTNDKVQVRVMVNPKDGRLYGDVMRIEKRASDKVFGVLHIKPNGKGTLEDKENLWGQNLEIQPQDLQGAKNNQLVQVEILSFPGHPKGFTGKVSSIIGEAGDPQTDTRRAIIMHSIPEGFSDKALKEAQGYPKEVTKEDIAKRKDLRDRKFITIDGVTAKDFDDAIYVESDTQGFHLWVAIADVSHYVKENSALDEDAYNKGNSSYFPHYVEPMLPEVLSNELCSLKPNVDRLTMVCEMRIAYDGELESYKFYEGVIHSHARVTYGEAQELVDGENLEKFAHVKDMILQASDLAKILMGKRYKEGSLNLEIPETEVIIDESGKPVDIIRSERVFAHQIIEELMLITNVATARFIEKHDYPGLFRTHERPDKEKIEILQSFLKSFGSDIKIGEKSLQKKLTRVLQKYHGHMEGDILSRLVLRSMKQASYTVENIGHFGLNFDHYAHFTSPIRRYPDLVIHRQIKSLIPTHHSYRKIEEDRLQSMATHLSATEQRSVKAERFLIGIKRARFIQSFLGDEFEGIITSVTKFGVFVSLRQYDVDGLIRVEDLGGDYFEYDEERLELIGKRSNFRFHLGQTLRILVANVNVELGQIDFVLAKDFELKGSNHDSAKNRTSRKHSKKRKKTKKNRRSSGKSRVSKSRRKNSSR